jgi:hypothetical protein
MKLSRLRFVLVLFQCLIWFANGSNAGQPLVLNAVVERDPNRDARAFELYGSFPAPEAVRPVIVCNGKLMQAEIMAVPLPGQINVNVEAMRGGSVCSFQLQRVTDGVESTARTINTSAPPIQINGMNDVGVTLGRRYVELYGAFATASALEPRVTCLGKYTPARIEFASTMQINVSFPDIASATNCALVLRNRDNGLSSPPFGTIQAPSATTLTHFGGYFWGGVPPTPQGSLVSGQASLNALGFDSTRLVMTPRMRTGDPLDNYYNLDLLALNSSCPFSTKFLPCAIRRQAYQAAISAPGLKTVVFTAYDSTSHGPTGNRTDFLDPTFWAIAANRQAAIREYRELSYALYDTQRNTGKKFILASWEVDNQAYCGSIFSYWRDPAFRLSCGDLTSRNAAIAGLIEWFRLRREGVRQGRAAAGEAGITGVTVFDGVEFNMNTLMYTYQVDDAPLRSALRDIVPAVAPDYVLYSSYDSQNRGHMEQDLREIKAWLASVAPRSKLIIGEVGAARHGLDAVEVFRTVETAKAIQRARLETAILWEAYDTTSGGKIWPFGLLDAMGALRDVTRILHRELSAQAAEIAANPRITVNAAVDRGVTNIGGTDYRFFELYGTYPGGPFTASSLCDGIETPVDVVFQSAGQINVRIKHRTSEERYCTIRIRRADGAQSLAFGPLVSCAQATATAPCF